MKRDSSFNFLYSKLPIQIYSWEKSQDLLRTWNGLESKLRNKADKQIWQEQGENTKGGGEEGNCIHVFMAFLLAITCNCYGIVNSLFRLTTEVKSLLFHSCPWTLEALQVLTSQVNPVCIILENTFFIRKKNRFKHSCKHFINSYNSQTTRLIPENIFIFCSCAYCCLISYSVTTCNLH